MNNSFRLCSLMAKANMEKEQNAFKNFTFFTFNNILHNEVLQLGTNFHIQ